MSRDYPPRSMTALYSPDFADQRSLGVCLEHVVDAGIEHALHDGYDIVEQVFAYPRPITGEVSNQLHIRCKGDVTWQFSGERSDGISRRNLLPTEHSLVNLYAQIVQRGHTVRTTTSACSGLVGSFQYLHVERRQVDAIFLARDLIVVFDVVYLVVFHIVDMITMSVVAGIEPRHRAPDRLTEFLVLLPDLLHKLDMLRSAHDFVLDVVFQISDQL